MATLDEVISQMPEEDYLHDSIQFVIDSDLRVISIPVKGVVAGVVGDKNVNRINFQMPRYYNGFDMSKFTTRVNYVNARGNFNYYSVTDLTIEDDLIYFTWLVDSDVVAYAGIVMFAVNMFIADSNGKITQSFNTSNKGLLNVLEGIQVNKYVTPDKQEDILTRLEADILKYVDSGITKIDENTNKSIQKIQTETNGITESITSGINNISSATTESINEIQNEGINVKNSIPADYTELNKTVSDITDQIPGWNETKEKVASLNYIMAEQFGAVGDGITDDTQAFKDAVAKSIETGKTLKLSPKTYVVSIIAIKKPIIMQGCGESTVIKHIGTGNLYAVVNIEGDNDGTVVLRDFIIDANRNGDTSGNIRGLNITRRKGTSVENITFKNGRNGAYIGYWDQTQHYPSDDVRFYKCKFEKNTMNELTIASGKNIKVVDCLFDSGACDSSLIDIEAHGDNASFDYVLLQNCYIKQNAGSKSVQCISNHYNNIKSYIIFDNCYIDSRIEITRMDNVRFINCNIKDLIEIKSSKNNIMESCVCDRIYNYSRKRFSEENETKDNHIRNCIINNGIIIQDVSSVDVKNCIIKQGSFTYSLSEDQVNAGVFLCGYADNIEISNCHIEAENGILYDNSYNEKYKYTEVYSDLLIYDCEFDCVFNTKDLFSDQTRIIDTKDSSKNAITKEYSGSIISVPCSTKGNATIITWEKRNLFIPYIKEDKIINGISITVNDDGTYTLNGSATSSAIIPIMMLGSEWVEKTFTFSGSPTGGSYDSYRIGCQQKASPWTEYGYDTGEGKTLTLADEASLSIRIANGYTCDNLVIKPMIEIGSEKHEYIPTHYSIKSKSIGTSSRETSVIVNNNMDSAKIETYDGGTTITTDYNVELKAKVPINIIEYIDSLNELSNN